ncbi:DUF4129 domain-containing protein [Aporhodopirellula aestuarii]|uniref:DUF4129 domain-containing protein n=1 Tax=Aporhodopirellula aestuarii TaxID=2950107 RepID=A0ABT0U625_9BACT|nr:DUF4129 domain-containing protein [Aporhodopirellula aestuarii]MCM2372380.1 DUF4129 domain-containing protein [Aporhodopirellula aestuarii]
MNRRYQTLADYAAIAIAPLLIFWMLYSLAGFLMLVLYHGNYPQRVMWTLFWYTMGATALARVTIEESRSYSSVYATALGAATFFVMLRFLGDPIFSAAIIMTIGYLADRIVHDCTIVDDGIDSSGQGLVDSARKWFENLRSSHTRPAIENESPSPPAKQRSGKQGHQPGRTVLYLALGALPLFGIGQFFLSGNPSTWERARWLLASYLFASLSLLVVTSFLNLRRYLRQRNTEMPGHVTIAWVLGGIGIILLILMFAFIAPLPGQAIVSFRMPDFLTNSQPTTASQYGWGGEGADQPGSEGDSKGAPRPDAKTPSDAPGLPTTAQAGAPPGGDSGNRDDGPTGKKSGGKKASEKSDDDSGKTKSDGSKPQANGEGEKGDGKKGDDSKSDSKSPDPDSPDSKSPQSKQPPPETQPSDSKPSESGKKPDSSQPSDSPESKQPQENQAPPESNDSESDPNQPQAEEPSDPAQSDSEQIQPQPNENQPNDSEPETPDSEPDERAEQKPAEASEQPAEPPTPPDPGSSTDWSGMLAGLGGLIKFLVIIGLLVIVAVYIYLNHAAFLAWWNRLFGERDMGQTSVFADTPESEPSEPARPFSSFENPIGKADAGQVVVVTFQALEAWGREHGISRQDDETPNEYTRRLVSQFPNLKQSAIRVVDAYNRVVYGRAVAGTEDVTAASSVWQIMRPQL